MRDPCTGVAKLDGPFERKRQRGGTETLFGRWKSGSRILLERRRLIVNLERAQLPSRSSAGGALEDEHRGHVVELVLRRLEPGEVVANEEVRLRRDGAD